MQHKTIKRYTYRRRWLRGNLLYFMLIGLTLFVFWLGFATKTVMYKASEFEAPLQETESRVKNSPTETQGNYPTQCIKTQISSAAIGATTTMDVLSTSPTKAYMDYKKITDKTSNQWRFIHTQQGVTVNNNGYLVTPDGYIGVALGGYFGDIGEKYLFELSSGAILKLIKVEEKADKDTCGSNYMAYDGSVIEFVVDPDKMQAHIWSNGLVWQGNFNNNPEFAGEIKSIWRVEHEN